MFDIKKSYCQLHQDEEIVFACYQCQVMCCSMCANMHIGHTKAYFKDLFVESNYENVEQTPQEVLQQNGSIHHSGNIFFKQDQVVPKGPEKSTRDSADFSKYNRHLLADTSFT